jgi:2-polyprenyl-3-methyl-5-hydroxy-6-metoxy-1,4-benzoquinol methylase
MPKSSLTCLREVKDVDLRNKILRFCEDDLEKYINSLSNLADLIQAEKEFNKKTFNDFARLNDSILLKGERLIKIVGDKKIIREIKKYFRELGGKYFYRSEMVDKGFKKYRGYPGDFEMMEFVYNNKVVSDDKLGIYFDKYFLDNPYAVAVRGRKDQMVSILKRFVSSSTSTRLNIMNVACGPCREIRETFLDKFDFNPRINYVCVDFEKDALSFSKQALRDVPKKVKIRFVQENIMDLIRRPEQYEKRLGKYDLVYSIGLGDYLSDGVVKKMMRFCWEFLKPGGQMVFAHKIEDKDPFAPVAPGWYCDWDFVPRTEDDVDRLIKETGLVGFSVSKEWESSQRIMYIRVKRNA